ncbi:MAG: hypothetical protein CMJ83_05455 [Planctomycetes bacterium]|nr:hypothetical protein [Planctomycetota bacterium]
MKELIRDIDVLLRGGFTRREDLLEGRVCVPSSTLVRGGIVLGCLAGACSGLYGGLRPGVHASFWQLIATSAKVPLLFLLTLMVTVPSLYVFSALSGSRLAFKETLRLLLGAIAVNLALLASFGPVIAFFTVSTNSYPFMVLLNVLFFAVAGLGGLVFLRRALDLVFEGYAGEPAVESGTIAKEDEPEPADPPPLPVPGATEDGQPLESTREVSPEIPVWAQRLRPRPVERSEVVFRAWIVIYGVVGAQMGWILRPFIGSPDQPFELFREREHSFFWGVFKALGELFAG